MATTLVAIVQAFGRGREGLCPTLRYHCNGVGMLATLIRNTALLSVRRSPRPWIRRHHAFRVLVAAANRPRNLSAVGRNGWQSPTSAERHTSASPRFPPVPSAPSGEVAPDGLCEHVVGQDAAIAAVEAATIPRPR